MGRRVDGSLGALLKGVSQQPQKQRLQGQVSEQINMTSDPVRMLHRRSPTQFLNKLDITGIDIETASVSEIDLATGETLFLIIPSNVSIASDILILDRETGLPYSGTVEFTTAFLNYVTTASALEDISVLSVGGTVFVTNITKAAALAADLSHSGLPLYKTNSGVIAVDVGQYSRDYTVSVTVNGTTTSVTHTTPDSTGSGVGGATIAEASIATDKIATELETLLLAEPTITTPFEVKRKADVIMLIPKSTATDYSISAHDGIGGGAMKVSSNNVVAALTDLPTRAPADSIYTVRGGSGAADDLYMRFDLASETSTTAEDDLYFQSGTWVETVKPGVEYKIDPLTMPHIITIDNTYAFGSAAGEANIATDFTTPAWADRLVGDAESNKVPEFIGQTINELIVFQDRLTFLSGEYIHMSVTSDFFNVWKKTVNTLLDDGPIGLSALAVEVGNLKYAVPHNGDLIIFSDKSKQFRIPGVPAVTPRNATMTETTSFRIQAGARPVPSGKNLFFALDSGAYSSIREFYTDSDLDSNNATPVTIAVERYIKGKVKWMESSTNLNKLIVRADSPNTLYVYEYLWELEEKIQEAWSKWVISDHLNVVRASFGDDALTVLATYGTDLHVLRIAINTEAELGSYEICLDNQAEVVTTGNTAAVDWLATDVNTIRAIQGAGCPNPGLRAEIASYDGTTVTFKRDLGGGTVTIGNKYISSVTPSTPLVFDQGGNVIGTSTLTIGEMFINFADSGSFDVHVFNDSPYTARNSGRFVGETSATIGEYNLTTGTFPVPVRAASDKSYITISTDDPYPVTILDIEWEGQFYKRGTRITRPR